MKCKRAFLLLLCLLLSLPGLSGAAAAAGQIDLQHSASLTISYRDGDTPLVGAVFQVYYVASVDADGSLTPTERFAHLPVVLDGKPDWSALATTLEGYVQLEDIPADSWGKTDESGEVGFFETSGKLPLGLYLVLGERHTQGNVTYEAQPILVMLPSLVEEELAYHVTARAKFRIIPPSPPPPGGGDDDDTVTRKVLKVWDDEGSEESRPKEIRVRLLRNGTVYDTVTLTAKNNWRHTWRELKEDARWTVVEEPVEGYTVSVNREGITFVVTNSLTEDPPDGPPPPPDTPDTPPGTVDIPPETPPKIEDVPDGPKLPQSGQLWWPVPVLAAAGLFLIAVGMVRRRGAEYES